MSSEGESEGSSYLPKDSETSDIEVSHHDKPIMGGALSKILSNKGPSSVLSKRKSVERKLQEEKLEKRARAMVRAELRESRDSSHQIPTMETANSERVLRKFATKGVVQLFNAVQQQQAEKEKMEKASKEKMEKASKEKKSSNNPKINLTEGNRTEEFKAMSKTNFLEVLKMSSSSKNRML